MSADGVPPVDVLLVDDHDLLAQSLRYALRAEGLRAEVCQDLEPARILTRVEEVRPRLVLLDFDLGEHGTSHPLIAPCRERDAHVVMLTGVSDRVALATCVEAGAQGLISKSQPLAGLVDSIRRIVTTGVLMPSAERAEWLAELRTHRASEERRLEPFERLTVREREVLIALVDGQSADHIAETAVVTLATVRSQIKSILAKLGVHSQLAAVALARRTGWPEAIDPA